MRLFSDLVFLLMAANLTVSVLWSGILLSRNGFHSNSNRFLALFMIASSLVLANSVLVLRGYLPAMGINREINNAIVFVIGPAIWHFIKRRSGTTLTLKNDLKHYLLTVIALIGGIVVHQTTLLQPEYRFPLSFSIILVYTLQFPAYAIAGLRLIDKKLSKENGLFQWLQLYLISMLIGHGCNLAVAYVSGFTGMVQPSVYYGISFAFSLFFLAFAFMCFRNPSELFDAPKYANTETGDEEQAAILEQLEKAILEQQLFRDKNLKLADVARETGLPSRQISQAVNARLSMNMSGYINQFRVREVINIFENSEFDHYSIDGIAESAGFGSRSVFYRVFKKETGLLPLAYRQSVQKGKVQESASQT